MVRKQVVVEVGDVKNVNTCELHVTRCLTSRKCSYACNVGGRYSSGRRTGTKLATVLSCGLSSCNGISEGEEHSHHTSWERLLLGYRFQR